jgi:PAS domain S-box-containing protein
MPQDKKDTCHDRSTKIFLLRDYTRTMGDRIASLRGRAGGDATGEILTEAFHELEVTREELAVANEEISSAEARFEEALRTLEARVRHYGELFDGAPDAYVLTDALGIVREGNRAFASMLGVPKRFLEGKPLVNFVARGDVRPYRDSLGALLRGERCGELMSLRLRPRHGEPVFVAEVIACIVRGAGDRVTSIRWSIRRGSSRTARRHEEPHADEGKPDSSPPDGA